MNPKELILNFKIERWNILGVMINSREIQQKRCEVCATQNNCLPSSSSNLLVHVCSFQGSLGADKHVGEHAYIGVPRFIPQELGVDLVMVVPHRWCLNLQSVDAHPVSIAADGVWTHASTMGTHAGHARRCNTHAHAAHAPPPVGPSVLNCAVQCRLHHDGSVKFETSSTDPWWSTTASTARRKHLRVVGGDELVGLAVTTIHS